MDYAPSTQLRALLADAIAVAMPGPHGVSNITQYNRGFLDGNKWAIAWYLEFNLGKTTVAAIDGPRRQVLVRSIVYSPDFNQVVLTAADNCANSWDGEDYAWDVAVDVLQTWLENFVGKRLDINQEG